MMALRAKQWEDEASKVKTPFPKDILYVQPEEPPLLPPGPLAELGKTRKRPLDMPDTDVDAEAKPHADNSAPPLLVDSGEQGIERKRARFAS
ncbi:unnamed protein product [Rhizoctonia solani]|uniref:Uncharacterized protein n=1 Tax=Rhizoctonia solani TaxID=456999 RepID=A0A8H2WY30_9AGAM|nr:unnamed protein product [Rhizoctonia solani]